MKIESGYELPLVCPPLCAACCEEDRTSVVDGPQLDYMEATGNQYEVKIAPIEDFDPSDPNNLPELLTKASADADPREIQNMSKELSTGQGVVRFIGRCTQLGPNGECMIYDSPLRPDGCGRLPVGGNACMAARRNAGRHDVAPVRQQVTLANLTELLASLQKRAG